MAHKLKWFSPPKTAYVGIGIVSWQGWVLSLLTFVIIWGGMYVVSDELLAIAFCLGVFLLYIVIVLLTGGRFTNPDVFS